MQDSIIARRRRLDRAAVATSRFAAPHQPIRRGWTLRRAQAAGPIGDCDDGASSAWLLPDLSTTGQRTRLTVSPSAPRYPSTTARIASRSSAAAEEICPLRDLNPRPTVYKFERARSRRCRVKSTYLYTIVLTTDWTARSTMASRDTRCICHDGAPQLPQKSRKQSAENSWSGSGGSGNPLFDSAHRLPVG